MRKLQYLFMTLSVLFLAVPAFAQGTEQASVGTDSSPSRLDWYGACRRALRPGPGPGNRLCYRSSRPQPWSAGRHPAVAHPGPRFMESLSLSPW